MRFVFLHGGPGFNSFAERAILDPVFVAAGHDVVFWNEPSRLRPDGEPFETADAFDRWLASAERCVCAATDSRPVHLVAHSLTVHAAADIARRHPDRVTSLVLVGPSADPLATFRNVLRLAHEDLRDAKPHIASAIAACLTRSHALFDEAMQEGLMNVLQDERLFSHYWADETQMQASMAAQARPEAQFDAESFFAVMTSFAQRGMSALPSAANVPAMVLFGACDPVTQLDEQRSAIERALPRAHIHVIDGCSHYLHLDRPGHFVDLVAEWAREVETPS
jgi:pimeloyl-ACP methyl ester carboxylesterase